MRRLFILKPPDYTLQRASVRSEESITEGSGQREFMSFGPGTIPLLTWFQNRKKKKKQKRQAEMSKAAKEAVDSSQAIATDEQIKRIVLYQTNQTDLQEQLKAHSIENKNLKHNIHHLEKKVLKLEKALFSASNQSILSNTNQSTQSNANSSTQSNANSSTQSNANSSIQSNALLDVETQTVEGCYYQSLEVFAYPQMPTPDLESLQTKVMSLEFTVFRQSKLMELMEETLKAYEPSFSLKPLYDTSL